MTIARDLSSSPYGSMGWLLTNVSDVVDLPPSEHQMIDRQFRDVGAFMAERTDGQTWDVFPQGSVKLGTVVRPLGGAGTLDVDMVCLRDVAKESTTQADLFEDVGTALEVYVNTCTNDPAPDKCEPARRSWKLCYPMDFHMDVLPAIPDLDAERGTAILITDKKKRLWLPSDPKAYADWFRAKIEEEFLQLRSQLAVKLAKSIEHVPAWEVKTTLQRVVQILKAHRDLHFGASDDRPPSILITTLVAHAYNGERDLFDAILYVTSHMEDYIEDTTSGPVVTSPVSDENFCDKWSDYPLRRKAFDRWLDKVQEDLEVAAGKPNLREAVNHLGLSFGRDRMVKAVEEMGMETRQLGDAMKLGVAGAAVTLTTAASAPSIPKHGFYGSTT